MAVRAAGALANGSEWKRMEENGRECAAHNIKCGTRVVLRGAGELLVLAATFASGQCCVAGYRAWAAGKKV